MEYLFLNPPPQKKTPSNVKQISCGALLNIDKQESIQLEELKKLEESQLELKKELEEQYGKISVNLEDGSYEEIPEEK